MASIIEREAVIAEEGSVIASVFLNRLALGMKLETDPTVHYAIGSEGDGWWTTGGEKTFNKIAEEMVGRGMSEKRVIEILTELYHAVSAEFGN